MTQLPSDSLKTPRRPWRAVAIVAGALLVIGGGSVGAAALTQSGPSVPRSPSSVVVKNVVPVAIIATSASDLTVTVDGSGSTDEDGAIVTYVWDFGDGGTSEGATASHTYTAAGDYTVTLTVHDDSGGIGSESGTVTAAAPPPPPPPPPPSAPVAGAPGTLVPFVSSSDPNNASGGDYIDPGVYCQSGSASGNPPRCD